MKTLKIKISEIAFRTLQQLSDLEGKTKEKIYEEVVLAGDADTLLIERLLQHLEYDNTSKSSEPLIVVSEGKIIEEGENINEERD